MSTFLYKKLRPVTLIVSGVMVILCVLAGYFIGFYIQKKKYASFLKSFEIIRANSSKYVYTNPLIGGVSAPATDVGVYSDIKLEITSYFRKEEQQGSLYKHSFYFRDLNTGFWFGDNESANFFPASLFKLPIAIAVYKQAEDEPSFLKKQFVYSEELSTMNTVRQLNAESSLIVGQSYSVETLVEKMLTLSDNGAKNLLLNASDKKYLNQLFNVMSFGDEEFSANYEVASRKYSHFLRILYGSSYLNEEHSELILDMLSKSTFRDGLVAGIPQTTAVAHKFGVYEIPEIVKGKEIRKVQLHDCGIIYHPVKPFIFCVMTEGKDTESLFRIISNVSKMIYTYQESYDINN